MFKNTLPLLFLLGFALSLNCFDNAFAAERVLKKSTKSAQTLQDDKTSNVDDSVPAHFSKSSRGPFAIYLGVNFASELETEGSIDNTSVGFTADYSSDLAPLVGLEYFRTNYGESLTERLGMSIGLSYEHTRTIDSATVSGAGLTITGKYTGKKPQYYLLVPYINANVSLTDQIYLLGGLNYSVPKYKKNDGDDLSVKGALGGQFGLGASLVEHIGMEAIFQILNAKVTYPGITYDSASLSGLLLRLRYHF